MPHLFHPESTIHWVQDGDPAGRPVVFAHALGLDLTIWDRVIPMLPQTLRLIRYDLRGHGGSACPPPPYRMGALVSDAGRLLDALSVRDAVFVGLSIGGMIAQGLAVKRLDQVRAMVLSNAAAKSGTAATWAARIEIVRKGGMAAAAPAILERWFGRAGVSTAAAIEMRDLLLNCREDGYIGCAAAIAGTDFYETTATLALPTLAIAGSSDGSTPADLVRETADLVKGAQFALIRGAGHLPPVDRPEEFARTLTGFLTSIGHC
jgi:3-oxoadipate enol-lactonase